MSARNFNIPPRGDRAIRATKRRSVGARSKAKGGGFERYACKVLSLWLSRGVRDDHFWRSAMSGGRATLRHRKGANNKTQVGDVSAIDGQGERVTKQFLIECKNYRDLRILTLLLPCNDDTPKGTLCEFWWKCCFDAQNCGRLPLLVCKQGKLGEFAIVSEKGRQLLGLPLTTYFYHNDAYVYYLKSFLLLARRP